MELESIAEEMLEEQLQQEGITMKTIKRIYYTFKYALLEHPGFSDDERKEIHWFHRRIGFGTSWGLSKFFV